MFKTVNGGKLPTKGSKYAAAVDLYAREDIVIGAGETAVIGLGVCIDMSDRIKDQVGNHGISPNLKMEKFLRGHLEQHHFLQIVNLLSLNTQN